MCKNTLSNKDKVDQSLRIYAQEKVNHILIRH